MHGDEVVETELAGEAVGTAERLGGEGGEVVDVLGSRRGVLVPGVDAIERLAQVDGQAHADVAQEVAHQQLGAAADRPADHPHRMTRRGIVTRLRRVRREPGRHARVPDEGRVPGRQHPLGPRGEHHPDGSGVGHLRGGHDPRKVYAAYAAAVSGGLVVLATVKLVP